MSKHKVRRRLTELNRDDPICRICKEPKSLHIKTDKGEFTHPREARGEGAYRLKSAGTLGALYPGEDDLYWEEYEFVPAAPEEGGERG